MTQKCVVCGGDVEPFAKPSNPADPWLCDGCARGNQVVVVSTGKAEK